MLQNFFKIAIRTLWKNKGLTAINLLGLSSGIAFSLLIFMFVKDELAYDRHFKDAHLIHRVVKDFINDDGSRIPDATTPGPLAAAMQNEIPEVETITRIHPNWGGTTVVEYDGKKITEEKVWRVDSSFFDVFSVKFIEGDRKTALHDINSIVLTASGAKRHFGNADPIGKTLRLNNQFDVTVTAVVEDVPAQTHFHYEFLLSYRRLPQSANTAWGSYNYYTYVKVKPGTDLKAFEDKIQKVYERNQEDRWSDFYTQAVTDIHLTSKLKWELEPNGDRLYVNVFIVICIFILVIAAINYINLSTAKSTLRAKETGIRKVSGAQRTSLIFQFLFESVILCVVASILALIGAYLLVPFVNQLTQKQLLITHDPSVILYVFLVTVMIGLVAGLFPAIYLSSFRPVAVLKGLKLNERGALSLRKSLVVVQFTISISLIIGAMIIYRQMVFIQSANLGFDKDQIVVVRNGWSLSRADRSAFMNSLRDINGITDVAASGGVLGQGFSTTRLRAQGSTMEQQLNFANVDYHFLDVVGMELKEGRKFSEEFPADTLNNGVLGGPLNQRLGGIVINERAVKEFGLGTPAVGKQLVWSTDADTVYYVEVVGVLKDFHFTSMRNEIKPFGFLVSKNVANFNIRFEPENISQVLPQVEALWKERFPEIAFEYVFLDQTFAKMYAAEERFQQIFLIMVVLGIMISCLGLFALAAFSAEQRVKEIGIRKVLGATVGQMVILMSKDFLKLVIIAMILAAPLAWYGMEMWLEGFAYRIAIEWWIFVLASIVAIVIAFLTISSQALKAAVADPAKSLRSE